MCLLFVLESTRIRFVAAASERLKPLLQTLPPAVPRTARLKPLPQTLSLSRPQDADGLAVAHQIRTT
jgi:hypothetical protein